MNNVAGIDTQATAYLRGHAIFLAQFCLILEESRWVGGRQGLEVRMALGFGNQPIQEGSGTCLQDSRLPGAAE